jgi:predicted RNA-binding Zn-ribbon protein involved in translation (DUF1610 family)
MNTHKDTYEARGYCTNCGRENYPQWGTYNVGEKLEDYPCPSCGCLTWRYDDREHKN